MKQKLLGFFTCLVTIFMAYALLSLAHAAPPEGKGKPDNPGQQGQGQGQDKENPGRGRSAEARAESPARGKSDEARTQASSAAAEAKVDRQHPHQERRAQAAADRADNANERVRLASAHGRGGDHGIRGRDAAKAHVDSLLKSLNKLEHARWDHNPHDTRGQGNMGKVDMRDPFGFDKDSGREGRDRGRPCRGTNCVAEEPIVGESAPTLNLSELVTVDFDFFGSYWQDALQSWIEADTAWYESLTEPTAYQTQLYQDVMDYYQYWVEYYSTFDTVSAIKPWATIDYTVNLPTTQELEGTTLLVTTRLTSLSNYDDVVSYDMTWYGEQSGWGENGWFDYELREEEVAIHYEVGDVVAEQTQEVTLGEQSTLSVSYNPPDELVGDEYGWGEGGGFFVELSVIVTDPSTGSSYTVTYDRALNLYRCPYGIVYDKQTGRPIAGAVITVHNADGSIAVLDKAANPNVSNPQTTDATGRYNAKLAIGKKYYLTVTAPGYAEYHSPLFSERWHIVREDVGLIRANADAAASPSPSLPTSTGTRGEVSPGAGFVPGFISGK